MKKRDIINLSILIAVVAYAAIAYYNKSYEYSSTEFLMDTIVNIKAVTKQKNAEVIVENTYEIMRELEAKLSCYKPESIVSRFNTGELDALPLDDDLSEIFDISGKLYLESDSLYDVSIGRLAKLWDFENEIIPTASAIAEASEFIGFYKLQISDNKLVKPAGVELNLGSLAKGYIIDKAVEYLMENGITSGFVNAGGDIRTFGQKKTLNIGIQHPRSTRGELVGKIKLDNGAIVTSGDYERFFLNDGVRYHHILNPKTGFPADTAVSVTVISDKAVLADAYSTALFLLSSPDAIKLANSLQEIEVKLFYWEEMELKSLESSGFKNYMQ